MGVDSAMIGGFLDGFLGWLLVASWKGAWVIGLVVGVQVLLRGRLPARFQDALWLLVLLRLAAPPLFESDWSLFNLGQLPLGQLNLGPLSSGMLSEVGGRLTRERLSPPRAPVYEPSDARVETPHKTFEPARMDALPEAAVGTLAGFRPVVVAFGVWLSGALLLLLVGLGSGLRLHLRVRRAPKVTDPAMLSLLEACRQRMGVRQPVVLVETDLVQGPAQLGILQPRLLLPRGLAATLTETQLRFIFCHELAHIRRGDVGVSQLAALVQVLHWFNPLVWWAFRRMRVDREVSCDALVLAVLEPKEHAGYGQTILTLLERLTAPRPVSGGVGILGRKTEIHRRIIMINRYKTASRLTSFLAVGMVAGLGWVTLTEARAPRSAAPQVTEATADRAEAASSEQPVWVQTSFLQTDARTRDVLCPFAGVRIVPPAPLAGATPAETLTSGRPAPVVHGLEAVKARLAEPLRLELPHATLPQVMEAFAAATGVKVALSAEVSAYLSKDRDFSMVLEAASAEAALRALVTRARLSYCVTDEGIHLEKDSRSGASARSSGDKGDCFPDGC